MYRVNWNNYKSAFDTFCDTQAQVIGKGNYNSLWNTYDIKEYGTINGDLQFYSAELAGKDFGLSVECQKKFYCQNNDVVEVGRYLVIDSRKYRIEYVAESKLGLTLLLREVDFDDKRKCND